MSARAPQPKPSAPLPTKYGVGPSCVTLPRGPWPTIAAFLCERFPAISSATWSARMAAGDVVDQAGERVTEERPYSAHQRIYYYRALASEPMLPVQERIIFQDECLVVADKPHFLPVVPAGPYVRETLLARLKHSLQIDTLTPVHRLDRETAGIVVFCVQPAMRGAYQDLFRLRRVLKHYEAIVHVPADDELQVPEIYRSRLEEDLHFMRMRQVEGTPNTQTRLRLLEVRGAHARLSLSPLTGRKHQLRVHCAALGMPVVHDRFYPELQPLSQDDYARPLQLLATTLAFQDPITGHERSFATSRKLMFD